MKQREIGFTQGVCYAVALLHRTGHMDARQVWLESGFTEKDLLVCDPYDKEAIEKMLINEEA